MLFFFFFFFSSRRRHTRSLCDWSSDVCSSDLVGRPGTHRCTIRRQATMCAKRSALTRSGTRVHGTAVANPPDHSGGGLAPLRSEAHTGAGQRPGGRGPRVQEGGGVRRRDGTRGGLRPPRGAKNPLASSHAGLIHRSAWKWNSPKFAVASYSSTYRQPLDNRPCCIPLGSKTPRLGSSSFTIVYQGVASRNSATT